MRKLVDILKSGDSVQLVLKKQGEPAAGIYKDEKREVRSPALQDRGSDDKHPARSTQ